jgi:hypothetical protein
MPSMQTVIETAAYRKDAAAAGLTEDERNTVVLLLAANPRAGVLIPGSGGARKLRVAGRGKGKSGGYRIITYFGGDDIPVFLMSLFSKGEKANLSKAEVNELNRLLSTFAAEYRESVRRRARRRRVK